MASVAFGIRHQAAAEDYERRLLGRIEETADEFAVALKHETDEDRVLFDISGELAQLIALRLQLKHDLYDWAANHPGPPNRAQRLRAPAEFFIRLTRKLERLADEAGVDLDMTRREP